VGLFSFGALADDAAPVGDPPAAKPAKASKKLKRKGAAKKDDAAKAP
jgi:hypothetical protein